MIQIFPIEQCFVEYQNEGCVCDWVVVGCCTCHNGHIGDRLVSFIIWVHVSGASRMTLDHKVGPEATSISIAVSFVVGCDAWWRFDIFWHRVGH